MGRGEVHRVSCELLLADHMQEIDAVECGMRHVESE